MYMPGRLRTASSPSSTRRWAALYVLSIVMLLASAGYRKSTRDTPRAGAGTRAEGRLTVTGTTLARHDADTIGVRFADSATASWAGSSDWVLGLERFGAPESAMNTMQDHGWIEGGG
jgi:hypothetical protein